MGILRIVVDFVLFSLLSITIFFVLISFSFVHQEGCVGIAFKDPSSTTYRSGLGRCEVKTVFSTTLVKRPIYIYHTSYGGDYLEGRKNGSGQYFEYSSLMTHATLNEALNKITYDGSWLDDDRDGWGILSFIKTGLVYTGKWERNHLNDEKGSLRYQLSHPDLLSASTPDTHRSGITYIGQVVNGVAHGVGIVRIPVKLDRQKPQSLNGDALIEGQFEDGILQSISSFTVGNSSFQIMSVSMSENFSTQIKLKVEDLEMTWNGKNFNPENSELENIFSAFQTWTTAFKLNQSRHANFEVQKFDEVENRGDRKTEL
eukprot:TRINITY_DN2875_c0_g1_i2.p1 TRINITY_DN2875_c0_g1~~TRINITY_DN2875_c0_g1_i2.p1  ORF type:complete len:329 (+),score=85.82 TRINITY_DN2875_c0_g1_i2:45-989(+)